MAKTLAAVMAVVVFAGAAAGCGSDSKSLPQPPKSTTTTRPLSEYAAQYLSFANASKEATDRWNAAIVANTTKTGQRDAHLVLADSLDALARGLLDSDWPETIHPVAVQLAQNEFQQAEQFRNLNVISDDSWFPNQARISSENKALVNAIRVLLQLPAVSVGK
jgi:hypothetical protein